MWYTLIFSALSGPSQQPQQTVDANQLLAASKPATSAWVYISIIMLLIVFIAIGALAVKSAK